MLYILILYNKISKLTQHISVPDIDFKEMLIYKVTVIRLLKCRKSCLDNYCESGPL